MQITECRDAHQRLLLMAVGWSGMAGEMEWRFGAPSKAGLARVVNGHSSNESLYKIDIGYTQALTVIPFQCAVAAFGRG